MRDIAKAINKRKGHCVFIDNIVGEQSPAAKLSLDEKLCWIESNIGCLPIDSVICQDQTIQSNKINVICQDLSHNKVAHHHDSEKLIHALENCVN